MNDFVGIILQSNFYAFMPAITSCH